MNTNGIVSPISIIYSITVVFWREAGKHLIPESFNQQQAMSSTSAKNSLEIVELNQTLPHKLQTTCAHHTYLQNNHGKQQYYTPSILFSCCFGFCQQQQQQIQETPPELISRSYKNSGQFIHFNLLVLLLLILILM